ncbi:protein of unknown function [Rhizobium sp. RU35A]|uniref:DUF4865 family protein n=1 Tax=Rhizobium sp. RU35A TaxID=1907414 RepID=UPI0009555EAF|nr:DUF4865 family protein [Rhizobium sp. RU35A]SIR14131.1 protein of unknown function [Rhizobium sp. RU35A]
MIAMQYSFTLPADYDMTVIDRRIREKGPLLDGFARLRFKAYLSARKQDNGFSSTENLYAPFYLWDEPEGIESFLTSPGFAALTRDFGWPSVQVWQVWQTQLTSNLGTARYAIRRLQPISPYSNLAEEREKAIATAESDMKAGALATVCAFDPTAWRRMEFSLWKAVPDAVESGQTYAVGHVSR